MNELEAAQQKEMSLAEILDELQQRGVLTAYDKLTVVAIVNEVVATMPDTTHSTILQYALLQRYTQWRWFACWISKAEDYARLKRLCSVNCYGLFGDWHELNTEYLRPHQLHNVSASKLARSASERVAILAKPMYE